MNDLLKEAIADAKAVRETAMANAKLALEEAFTPKLQSMLSAKLQNEMDHEEDEVEEMGHEDVEEMHHEGEHEEAELEVEEGEAEGEEEELDLDIAAEEEAPADDLEMEDEVEDELDLESIIKELELEEEEVNETEEAEEEEIEAVSEEEVTEETTDEITEEEGDEDEEVDLDEIIAALKEEDEEDEYLSDDPAHLGSDLSQGGAAAGTTVEAKHAELEEAYGVIKFLKDKINEINLLNAKLLFSNKLFKAYNLNEGQKVKVIENFDRATTLREVKLVYATIAESFANNNKRTVNEGTASKPVASTAPSKQVIAEGNDLADRFKKLAGLIK